jgi:hypothetical protein
MTEERLFERGLQRRREVLGGEYVDANLSESDEFLMPSSGQSPEWPGDGRGADPASTTGRGA